MAGVEIFNRYYDEYENWFDKNKYVYLSELEAVKYLLPEEGKGVEIGVGTGRFAVPLGITIGVEPSEGMANIARSRGVKVYEGVAEQLPFDNNSFDYALLIVTICFVDDPELAIKETYRILKKGGSIIVGIVDKSSFLGEIYEKKKEKNKFYKNATFFSAEDIINLLIKTGFQDIESVQTLFGSLENIREKQKIKKGYGEGGFVVIRGIKKGA